MYNNIITTYLGLLFKFCCSVEACCRHTLKKLGTNLYTHTTTVVVTRVQILHHHDLALESVLTLYKLHC